MLQLAKRDYPGSVEQSIYRHPKATKAPKTIRSGVKIRFVLELTMKDCFLHFVSADGSRKLQRKSVCGHLPAFFDIIELYFTNKEEINNLDIEIWCIPFLKDLLLF